MGDIREHPPAQLIVAAISSMPQALEWAAQRATRQWGPAALVSPAFDFRETEYYRASMGPNLLKQFIALQGAFDPADLAHVKRTTNQWEQEFAESVAGEFPRPLNLDPGYLTEAKLVLATTKDRDHRIYLHSGIYAEVTLHYHGGRWEASRWTYPDYQRPDFHEFFDQCRRRLRSTARGDD